MANRIATILGVVFLLVGVAGFFAPTLLGAHFSTVHNVIHLVSGAVALWIGLKGSPSAARTFCLVFGAVYLLLGIAGFAMGTIELPGLHLGTVDHAIHVVFGVLFLLGAFATKASPTLPLPPPRQRSSW